MSTFESGGKKMMSRQGVHAQGAGSFEVQPQQILAGRPMRLRMHLILDKHLATAKANMMLTPHVSHYLVELG